MIRDFFKWLFCKHEYEKIGELFGDQRNYYGGRYVYKCKKCGNIKYK